MRNPGLLAAIYLTILTGAALEAAGDVDPPAGCRPFDLQGFIDGELAAGKKQVVIPPGRYLVTPRNREHLRLQDLKDTEIIGDGTEIICTQTTRVISIEACENLTLRGLTIDFDPLPYTQGRIDNIAADKRSFEIELYDGYPTSEWLDKGSKCEIFGADTQRLRAETCFRPAVEALSATRVRVTKPKSVRPETSLEQIGDVAVLDATYAPGGSIPHAIYSHNCRGLTIEGLTVFASNCFGFLEVGCDGSTYRRCRVDRRPPAADIRPRAFPRMRSLNADAYHSKSAGAGPSYIECVAHFQGDDCVAINGNYHLVTACEGAVLRVLPKTKEAIDIQAGDPVELATYAGERLPDAKVIRVEPSSEITEPEKEFIARQGMDARLKRELSGARACRLTLDRAVDLPQGSLIAAANRMGAGFKIIGCELGDNRSRGIVLKASDGEIRENTISGCWSEAIKVSPEYWWLEAGSSNNVRIESNVIRDCRGVAVFVSANGGSGDLAPAGAHSNIHILRNRIERCPAPGITVTSTRGLELGENALSLDESMTVAPQTRKRLAIDKPQPILLINVEEVEQKG